jgi:cytochrome c
MQSRTSILKAWPRAAAFATMALALALLAHAPQARAQDANAAEQLVKDNKCTKCHAVDRKKDGPAFRDVAAKFKPEADAKNKIAHHVTSGEKVKFPDGHEEKHKQIKVRDQAELDNLVLWILSLEGGTKY